MKPFPNLPDNYDRFHEALVIVDPGASNPAGVALAIHQACRQVIHEGTSQRNDPAVRLMTPQLAWLVSGDSNMPCEDYQALLGACRARAAKAETPLEPRED